MCPRCTSEGARGHPTLCCSSVGCAARYNRQRGLVYLYVLVVFYMADHDGTQAAVRAQETQGIRVATSASTRNQIVGIDGTIEGVGRISNDVKRRDYNRTIGTSTQVNAYTAALASIEVAAGTVAWAVDMGELSPRAHGGVIHVFTNNQTALATLRTPNRRSGQAIVSKIWRRVKHLKESSKRVIFAWAPVHAIFELGERAKRFSSAVECNIPCAVSVGASN